MSGTSKQINETEEDNFPSLGNCGPTLYLEDGVKIDDILKGAEIEFSADSLNEQMEGMDLEAKNYFDGMSKFSHVLDSDSDEEEEDSSMSWFERMKLKMHNITDNGGVKKLVRREGVGAVVPAGCKIRAHYSGYLEDLDEPFDSSRLRHKELQITLGRGDVIPGLDIGIATMRKNEISRFLIDSSYAYGAMGCPPRIPENASVLFEVELINFTDSSIIDDFEDLSEDEKRDLPFNRILEVAKACNLEGNDCHGREHYGQAVKKYKRAINTLESANLRNAEQEEQVVNLCVKFSLNLALCQLRLGNFGQAVSTGKRVLTWKKEHPKALYICGKGLRHMGQFSSSRSFLLRAHKTAPQSKDVVIELRTLDKVEAKSKAIEKSMCQKMFGTS